MSRPGSVRAGNATAIAAMPLTPPRRGGRFRSSRVPHQSEYTLIRPSDCPTNQDHLKQHLSAKVPETRATFGITAGR